jgi:hypothetical protein
MEGGGKAKRRRKEKRRVGDWDKEQRNEHEKT